VAAFAALVISVSPSLAGGAAASSDPDIVDAVSQTNIEGTISYLESLGTREFHTEGAALAATFIFDEFEAMGLDVQRQDFDLDSVTVSNIVAVIQGTSADAGVCLVGAHYDSENNLVDTYDEALTIPAPGADDDASGVAAVLEVARVLASSGATPENTIKFVAFGAEEMGYNNMGGTAGSSYFVQQEAIADVEYEASAILDMIGYRDGAENVISLIKDGNPDPLSGAFASAVDEHGLDLRVDEYTAAWATYSDHASFWNAHYPSFLVIEEMDPDDLMPVNPYYHTSGDTFQTLSLEQVVVVTQALVGGLLEIAWPEEEGGGVPTEAVVAGAAAGVGGIAVAAYYIRQRRSER
jgi:leucyl aminopeptidase